MGFPAPLHHGPPSSLAITTASTSLVATSTLSSDRKRRQKRRHNSRKREKVTDGEEKEALYVTFNAQRRVEDAQDPKGWRWVREAVMYQGQWGQFAYLRRSGQGGHRSKGNVIVSRRHLYPLLRS